jgi:hypothetical protein
MNCLSRASVRASTLDAPVIGSSFVHASASMPSIPGSRARMTA